MYSLTEQKIEQNGIVYSTYGIAWQGEERMEIADISLCREAVQKLVAQLNAQELHPVHLADIVADFLSLPPAR